MKILTRFHLHHWIAATLLLAGLTAPVLAQHEVPFKGTFQGTDTVDGSTITTNGTGVATHLGDFSLTQETFITNAAGGSGTAVWTAANGDTLDSTFDSTADFSTVSLGYITVKEVHTVTGGTGRFANANGTFILQRTHILEPLFDDTHFTYGSFEGSITSPGANH